MLTENLNVLKTDITYLVNGRRKCKIDDGFGEALRIYNESDVNYKMPLCVKRDIQPATYKHDDTTVIAFSGGKLSLACAIRYKDVGKKIVLVHIAEPGKDVSRIQKIADMLDVPLYIEYEHLKPTHFKGMQIALKTLLYAIDKGYSPRIVYGYFDSASIYNNDVSDWMNCVEFMGTFKNVAQKYIDGFTLLNPIPNYSIMWDEILKHKAYIPYIEYSNNIDRRVFENIMMDYRLTEADKAAYFKNLHYLKNLSNRRKQENLVSLNELWNEYFFYRIENSVFYKDLMEKSFSSI